MVKIKKDMTIAEVVSEFPEVAEVLISRGLHCIGCGIGAYETIEDGCRAHGILGEDFEDLLSEMNDVVEKNDS